MPEYVTNFDIMGNDGNFKNVLVRDSETFEQLNSFINGKTYITYPSNIITKNKRYYINSTTGNDSNDGLSDSKPFKTLQHFLDITVMQGIYDARCYITGSGTYSANIFTITACTTHISATVDNVIVNLTNDSEYPIAFYDCHVNFDNITLTGPGIYFDSGSISASDCTFNCEVSSYGGYVRLLTCSITNIDAEGCFITLNKPTFTNKYSGATMLELDNCTLEIIGRVSYAGGTAQCSFAEFYSCTVFLNSGLGVCAGKYKSAIMNNSIFIGTGTRILTLFQTSDNLPTVDECRFTRIQNAVNFSLYDGESSIIPIPLMNGKFTVSYDFGNYRRVRTFDVVSSNRYEISETHIDSNGAKSYIACCNFQINQSSNGISIEITRNGTTTIGGSYDGNPVDSAKFIKIQYVTFCSF